MVFCSEHRLPEDHDCPFDLISKNGSSSDFIDRDILYQDALKHMKSDIEVADIYDYATRKKLSSSEATKLLSAFIESSMDPEFRINSIKVIELLNLKTDDSFQILEICLLTDEDSTVRKEARRVLEKLFPKESRSLMEWYTKDLDG